MACVEFTGLNGLLTTARSIPESPWLPLPAWQGSESRRKSVHGGLSETSLFQTFSAPCQAVRSMCSGVRLGLLSKVKTRIQPKAFGFSSRRHRSWRQTQGGRTKPTVDGRDAIVEPTGTYLRRVGVDCRPGLPNSISQDRRSIFSSELQSYRLSDRQNPAEE